MFCQKHSLRSASKAPCEPWAHVTDVKESGHSMVNITLPATSPSMILQGISLKDTINLHVPASSTRLKPSDLMVASAITFPRPEGVHLTLPDFTTDCPFTHL